MLSEDGASLLEAGGLCLAGCRPENGPHLLKNLLQGNVAGLPAQELLDTVLSVRSRVRGQPLGGTKRGPKALAGELLAQGDMQACASTLWSQDSLLFS